MMTDIDLTVSLDPKTDGHIVAHDGATEEPHEAVDAGDEDITDEKLDGFKALVDKMYATLNTAFTEESKASTKLIPIAEMIVPEFEEPAIECDETIQFDDGDDAGIEVEEEVQMSDVIELNLQPSAKSLETKGSALEVTSQQKQQTRTKRNYLKSLLAPFRHKKKTNKQEVDKDLPVSKCASTAELPAEIEKEEAPGAIQTETHMETVDEKVPAKAEENDEAATELERTEYRLGAEEDESPAGREKSEETPVEMEENNKAPTPADSMKAPTNGTAPVEMEQNEDEGLKKEGTNLADVDMGVKEIPTKAEVSEEVPDATGGSSIEDNPVYGTITSSGKSAKPSVDEAEENISAQASQEPSMLEEIETILQRIKDIKNEDTADTDEPGELTPKKKRYLDLLKYFSPSKKPRETIMNELAKSYPDFVKYFSLSEGKERGFEVLLDDFVNFLLCTGCECKTSPCTAADSAMQEYVKNEVKQLDIDEEVARDMVNLTSENDGNNELVVNKYAVASRNSNMHDPEEECAEVSSHSEAQESRSIVDEEPEKATTVSLCGSARSRPSNIVTVSAADELGNHESFPPSPGNERECINEVRDPEPSHSQMIPFTISSISKSGSSFDTSCTSLQGVKHTNSIISRVSMAASRISRKSRSSGKASMKAKLHLEKTENMSQGASRSSRKSRRSNKSAKKRTMQEEAENVSQTASRLSRQSRRSNKSAKPQGTGEVKEDVPVSKTLASKAGFPPLPPKQIKANNDDNEGFEQHNADDVSTRSSIGRVPSKVEVPTVAVSCE